MNRRTTDQLEKEWRRLTKGGLIAQGTLIERWYDRTIQGKKQHYGPYYCWTRKVGGKTKTLALSKEQARQLRSALAANRRVLRALATLYAMSERDIMLETPGVTRRNRLIGS